MKISKDGLDLIKSFEGFRSKPYLCPAGVPTIGYGTTYYEDGTHVTLDDEPVTKKEATKMLEEQVNRVYGSTVSRYVTSDTTQNQYNALVSFTYNLGAGNLKSSTLLKKHNRGDYKGASKEFKKWVKAGGKKLKGLERRRKAEKELYLQVGSI